MAQVVRDHIEKCRSYDFLRHAKAVIIIEANTNQAIGVEASLDQLQIPNMRIMTEENPKYSNSHRDLPGTMTTKKNKNLMVYYFIDRYLKPGLIGFSQPFIVSNYECSRIDDMKAEILTELKTFKKKKKAVNNRDGTTEFEIFFTGKEGSANDDYVMALLLGTYWKERFFKDPKYRNDW